ncbi:MAG: orotidine 5'-phosphate decarboxylase [Candidatus Moraniibacteriota bacterium]|nr:MAG: orotidine 5'-phosphate decarboxylase [Candidatus Moranbacteria bacterium]
MNNPKIIVDLDHFYTQTQALAFAMYIDPNQIGLRIGLSLFVRTGPDIIKHLTKRGFQIFLDLKFNDIPETMVRAIHSLSHLEIWMLSVSAFSSTKGLHAIRNYVNTMKHSIKPLLIAETVLSNLDPQDLNEIGFLPKTEIQIQRLAKIAFRSQFEGIICPPKEILGIRKIPGIEKDFLLLVPFENYSDKRTHQSNRILSLRKIYQNGGEHCILMVGQEIIHSVDPMQHLEDISKDIPNFSFS